MPDDLEQIKQILRNNSSKNFVKRIQEPDKWPTLDLGGGQVGTHLMAWNEVGGKYYVYPTIQYIAGSLRKLDPETAWQNAFQSGEYIAFPNAKEADWFSKNYKKVWE